MKNLSLLLETIEDLQHIIKWQMEFMRQQRYIVYLTRSTLQLPTTITSIVYRYSVKVKVASSQGASLDLQIRFVEIRFSRNAILDTSFIQLYICIRSKISVLQFLVTHIEYGDTNGTS